MPSSFVKTTGSLDGSKTRLLGKLLWSKLDNEYAGFNNIGDSVFL